MVHPTTSPRPLFQPTSMELRGNRVSAPHRKAHCVTGTGACTMCTRLDFTPSSTLHARCNRRGSCRGPEIKPARQAYYQLRLASHVLGRMPCVIIRGLMVIHVARRCSLSQGVVSATCDSLTAALTCCIVPVGPRSAPTSNAEGISPLCVHKRCSSGGGSGLLGSRLASTLHASTYSRCRAFPLQGHVLPKSAALPDAPLLCSEVLEIAVP